MICQACQRRACSLPRRLQLPRTFSTAILFRNAAVAAVSPANATASGDESADITPTPAASAPKTGQSKGHKSKLHVSSCPEGTVLTGLNYMKGKTDPVALADDEYPEWLWQCLDVMKKEGGDSATDDAAAEFSKSKKQRRLAAKKQRLLEAKLLAAGDLEALAPKVPLQHQSINLPGGEEGEGLAGAVVAAQKRDELRRAMRKERRAKIKEDNYLRSM